MEWDCKCTQPTSVVGIAHLDQTTQCISRAISPQRLYEQVGIASRLKYVAGSHQVLSYGSLAKPDSHTKINDLVSHYNSKCHGQKK